MLPTPPSPPHDPPVYVSNNRMFLRISGSMKMNLKVKLDHVALYIFNKKKKVVSFGTLSDCSFRDHIRRVLKYLRFQ